MAMRQREGSRGSGAGSFIISRGVSLPLNVNENNSEDLLDISKENEIEIAAAASEAASTITRPNSISSRRSKMSSYATRLFPRVTQV